MQRPHHVLVSGTRAGRHTAHIAALRPLLTAHPVQRSDADQFLFDTSVSCSVRETVDALAEVHNLRHRIAALRQEGEELAKHGPAKRPEQQGIDEYAEAPVDKGPHYLMDPTGRRTGNGKCCTQRANAARGGGHGGGPDAPGKPPVHARMCVPTCMTDQTCVRRGCAALPSSSMQPVYQLVCT